jgi:Ca-activated chloride channel family protein
MIVNRLFRAALLALALISLAPTAMARQVSLTASLDTPVLLGDGAQTAYMRVALKGFELADKERPPINLAIVLDRSGSMQGDKIVEAKRAAILALDFLTPDDILSIVTYDSGVNVLVPATKVTDPEYIANKIRSISVGGNTALFAGVSKGAAELRKFLDPKRVNRVILLSDGLANVGPSTPEDLGTLGAGLSKEGIAVTTIGLGLGYNETLMTRLAEQSDGNHFFAEAASDLNRVYLTELGELTSVIAQAVDVTIHFPEGVKPLRVLGRDAVVGAHSVTGHLNQLYARQTKYFLIEVSLPAGEIGKSFEVGKVAVTYDNLVTHVRDRLESQVLARHAAKLEEVEAARDKKVSGSVVRQQATLKNKEAMRLRDVGKIDEAKGLLMENAQFLKSSADRFNNPHLAEEAMRNEDDASNLDEDSWGKKRKEMESNQLNSLRALGYVE